MEITWNTTGMEAGFFVTADKDARYHCVVVAKGTFDVDATGHMTLAAQQRALVAVDEHHGDPASTSIRYASDFVLHKPAVDVLVAGFAVAPHGKPVRELTVRLEIQGRVKEALVLGDRHWLSMLGGFRISDPPEPFVEMPLVYERAFGGVDNSRSPHIDVDRRNLLGVGFFADRTRRDITNTALPNLERSNQRITSPRDRPEPIGFGCLSAASLARAQHAGTYDARWLANTAPFLPADFDPRFFQVAPEDQRVPLLGVGDLIRCVHMAVTPVVEYRMPLLAVPVEFGFVSGPVTLGAALDTVVLEPHLGQAMLLLRASVALPKKLSALREIGLGSRPADMPVAYRDGKPVFRGLGGAVRSLRARFKRALADS